MGDVRIKICGITNLKDLECAVDAGADAVGFLVDFPDSPRNLTLEKAYELIRKVPVFVESVVVIVPENLNRLIKVCEKLSPSTVQVHSSNIDGAELRREMPKTKLVRAFSLNQNELFGRFDVTHYDAALLDSYIEGKYGGTGIVHDWNLSRKFKEAIRPKPLILAGGLNVENVGEAIRTVQPYGVDVSSGVELKPGVKDPEKIFRFIRQVKAITYEV